MKRFIIILFCFVCIYAQSLQDRITTYWIELIPDSLQVDSTSKSLLSKELEMLKIYMVADTSITTAYVTGEALNTSLVKSYKYLGSKYSVATDTVYRSQLESQIYYLKAIALSDTNIDASGVNGSQLNRKLQLLLLIEDLIGI